jgi:hypothetical protein
VNDYEYEMHFGRFKKWITAAVIAFSAITAPTVAIVWDDGVESTQVNKEQTAEIEKVKTDLASMKLELSRMEFAFDPDKKAKLRPGFCACIAKDNAIVEPSRKFLDCPAKNFVCDKESREICDKQHPAYDC